MARPQAGRRRPRVLIALWLLAAPAAAADGPRPLDAAETAAFGAVGVVVIRGLGECSGFLVAPRVAVTAGHCLYDPETGFPVAPDAVTFVLGGPGARVLRPAAEAALHPDYPAVAPLWKREPKSDAALQSVDVAVLRLARPAAPPPLPLDDGLEPLLDGTESGLAVVGFGAGRMRAPAIQSDCPLLGRSARLAVVGCASVPGASGAPLLRTRPGPPTVVGVVVSGSDPGEPPRSSAVRIGDWVRRVVEMWR